MSPFLLFVVGLILLFLSLGFLAAELFLPSHGALSIAAALFAIGGVAAMFMAHTTAGVVVAILVLIAAPIAFFYMLRIYPNTPMGRRVILARPKAITLIDPQAQFLASLAGREGIAATLGGCGN